ncbi:Transcriptional regulator, LysR family [plant metagenome]|uniref:Transcriptional regulator, LysR family n=1 Tax=plant metagenome TaxID=1297885 RepID=A0A484SR35_9ZZZZ
MTFPRCRAVAYQEIAGRTEPETLSSHRAQQAANTSWKTVPAARGVWLLHCSRRLTAYRLSQVASRPISLSEEVAPSRLPTLLALCRKEEPEAKIRLYEAPLSLHIKELHDVLST